VGDTGPGGGIVFYVHASGTFTCGATLASTCKYLEAAPADQSTGIVWSTTAAFCYLNASDLGASDCQVNSIYSNAAGQAGSRTAATAIGKGRANTNQIHARLTTAGGALTNTYAAGIAYAYANNGKTDWYLPSKDELNEWCKYARTQTTGDTTVICANTGTLRGGFSAGYFWSSSEVVAWGSSEEVANGAWLQNFLSGGQLNVGKFNTGFVRPVRAFGGTLACADGGVCAVGDTGPGGGIVFYVASTNFTSTGSDCGTTCKNLEAAPTGWGNGITVAAGETTGTSTVDPQLAWCSDISTLRNATTKTAIGDGRLNTTNPNTGAGACTTGAIYHAELYAGNGKTDWHLPSKDELNELCKYAKNQPPGTIATVCAGTGVLRSGFSSVDYWSSSESNATSVWGQAFYTVFGSNQYLGTKNINNVAVRPVRAFG
jgi:hypothetical protein